MDHGSVELLRFDGEFMACLSSLQINATFQYAQVQNMSLCILLDIDPPIQRPTAPSDQSPQPQHFVDAVGRGNTTS